MEFRKKFEKVMKEMEINKGAKIDYKKSNVDYKDEEIKYKKSTEW